VETEDEPPFLARLPPRRLARIGLAGVVALAALWWVFADPIAHVWYQSRQQALTSQVDNPAASRIPKTGQQVGLLEDPAIGLKVVVAEGDTPAVLRGGPGHRPHTPLPGALGNSVVYGHAGHWGAPFARISRMAIGQKLYLQARYGVFSVQAGQTGYFIYTVTSVATVADNDTAPLASSSDYRLTMITDGGGSNKVVVVTAVSGPAGQPSGRAHAAAGRTRRGPAVRSIEPAKGAVWWNATVASFLLRAIAAATVIVLLVRHHRPAVAAAVSVPLLLAVLLPLFLELDLVAFRPLA
jgi:LPXTG-site transpeptidase (sortase) family protein